MHQSNGLVLFAIEKEEHRTGTHEVEGITLVANILAKVFRALKSPAIWRE
jgi:hypothetical protein